MKCTGRLQVEVVKAFSAGFHLHFVPIAGQVKPEAALSGGSGLSSQYPLDTEVGRWSCV